MKHLPIDPLIALALTLSYFVAAHVRRRLDRAHRDRLFRSMADVGSNGRGSR